VGRAIGDGTGDVAGLPSALPVAGQLACWLRRRRAVRASAHNELPLANRKHPVCGADGAGAQSSMAWRERHIDALTYQQDLRVEWDARP